MSSFQVEYDAPMHPNGPVQKVSMGLEYKEEYLEITTPRKWLEPLACETGRKGRKSDASTWPATKPPGTATWVQQGPI